jgi:hypothetical protein
MLQELYRTVVSRYLSPDQLITLEILVWLIQVHKNVKIERLAAHFSLPIKYESRRRRIQRFLKLNTLSVVLLTTNIKKKKQGFQPLKDLEIKPGESLFLQEIKVSKKPQANHLSLGIYWRRKYGGMGELEPWYLLTNLPNLGEAVKAYKKRVGIEAMFKDCKTGGYNLEGSSASIERLTRLVLLIAIAYTHSTLKGQSIRVKGQYEYIGRKRKVKQTLSKNSNFWIGLYGSSWIICHHKMKDWVEEIMRINSNKLPFYQRGLKAMNIIQQAIRGCHPVSSRI